MINDPSYDPLRQQIHNQGYLLIHMKNFSQMEKSVLMISNVKYIYWYFLQTSDLWNGHSYFL